MKQFDLNYFGQPGYWFSMIMIIKKKNNNKKQQQEFKDLYILCVCVCLSVCWCLYFSIWILNPKSCTFIICNLGKLILFLASFNNFNFFQNNFVFCQMRRLRKESLFMYSKKIDHFLISILIINRI